MSNYIPGISLNFLLADPTWVNHLATTLVIGSSAMLQDESKGEASREELEEELARLVLALDEPYRSSVLLRFYEGMTIYEISTRLHVHKETIRQRIKIGLEQMRIYFDSNYGSRQAWCRRFLPLTTIEESLEAEPPAAQFVAPQASLKELSRIAALFLMAIFAGVFFHYITAQDSSSAYWIGGKILDVDGNPMAGIRLRLVEQDLQCEGKNYSLSSLLQLKQNPEMESDHNGNFRFSIPSPQPYHLFAWDPSNTALISITAVTEVNAQVELRLSEASKTE